MGGSIRRLAVSVAPRVVTIVTVKNCGHRYDRVGGSSTTSAGRALRSSKSYRKTVVSRTRGPREASAMADSSAPLAGNLNSYIKTPEPVISH